MPERHTTTLDIKVDDREVTRLQKEIERTFSTRSVEAFNDVIERQTKALQTLIKQQEKLQQSLEATRKSFEGGQPGAAGGGGRPGHGGMRQGLFTALGAYLGTRMGLAGGHGGVAHKPPFEGHHGHGHGPWGWAVHNLGTAAAGHLVPHLVGGMPGLGPVGQGLIEGSTEMYEKAAAAAQSRVGAFGRSGVGEAGIRALTGGSLSNFNYNALSMQLGMSSTEIAQRLAGLGTQTGLRGGQLMGVAPALLQAQRYAGLDSAGALLGGAGAAGGRVDSQRSRAMLEDAIGTGLATGIREGRLDQFIQSVGQFTEQMRNQGIMIEPESMNALIRGLGEGQGLRGMAGAQLAQRATQGLAGALKQPGLLTNVLMQTMGVGQPGGPSYVQARKMLEGDEETLRKFGTTREDIFAGATDFIRGLIKEGPGVSARDAEETRALMIEQAFGQAGISTSMIQASSLARQQGVRERMTGVSGARAGGRRYLGRERARMEPGMGIVRFETMEERKRELIGESDEIREMMQAMHEADLAAVKTILPTLAPIVTGSLKFAKEVIEAATDTYKGKLPKRIRNLVEKAFDPTNPGATDEERTAIETYRRNLELADGDEAEAMRMTMEGMKARRGRGKARGKGKGSRGPSPTPTAVTGAPGAVEGTPLKQAADHAQQMAARLAEAAASEGEDMVITLDEAAGGYD